MMRKIFLIIAVAVPVGQIWSLTARQIMEKNDNLPSANTSVGTSAMVILKGSQKTIKEFSMIAKKFGKADRSRITFVKPTSIELLSHSAPGKESEQWLKLSGGKVRKISSSEKSGAFVNSHFYYEDLSSRELDDYNYTSLPDAKVGGDDCYVVESVKKGKSPVYSKAVMFVRKSDFFIVQGHLYEKNKHTKTIRNEKIQKISGILTPHKVVMERTDGKGKTFLYLQSIKYNVNVSDNTLSSSGF